MNTRVIPATVADVAVLRLMAAAYMRELAPCYPPGVRGPAIRADDWWRAPSTIPFLVSAGGVPAGFVVVIARPRAPDGADYCLAEFYIVPRFRRSTVGMAVGALLARAFPGTWTADVLVGNAAGRRFARAMARRFGRDVTIGRIDGAWGPGIRFRFTVE
ncbi:MAG: hypothetical protein ACLQVD_17970 [Capsulimonadaceae bacterium]